MPPSYARINPIEGSVSDIMHLMRLINQRIDDINQVFQDIALADSEMRGNDNFNPTFKNDVDMSRKRVTNAERSREPRDVVTRVELEELGILGNKEGINFLGDVSFGKGARTTAPPGGGNSYITEERVIEIVEQLISEALAVAFDGTRLTVRTLGTNGTDSGNPVMGRDDTGRAEFIQSFNKHLMVHDGAVVTLLTLILAELRRLNGDPDNWQPDAESG